MNGWGDPIWSIPRRKPTNQKHEKPVQTRQMLTSLQDAPHSHNVYTCFSMTGAITSIETLKGLFLTNVLTFFPLLPHEPVSTIFFSSLQFPRVSNLTKISEISEFCTFPFCGVVWCGAVWCGRRNPSIKRSIRCGVVFGGCFALLRSLLIDVLPPCSTSMNRSKSGKSPQSRKTPSLRLTTTAHPDSFRCWRDCPSKSLCRPSQRPPHSVQVSLCQFSFRSFRSTPTRT